MDEDGLAKLLCRLETSDAWSSVTPWTQSVDRTYLLQTGLQVLTSCDTPTDASGTPTYVVTHVMQTDVAHVDLQWTNVDPTNMLCGADGTASAVRVSLVHDEPVFEEELQERVDEMTRVDIKQRRSFSYASRGVTAATWNIDVMLLWRKTSYLDALMSMRNREAPLYMVELRCVQPLEHLALCENAYDHLALNCLLKVADLFAAGTCVPVSRCGARLVPDRAVAKVSKPPAETEERSNPT